MKKSYSELLAGYRSFRADCAPELLNCQKQRPQFLVISCSDSRVIPNFIFKAASGDIFTARNIANLVPPYDDKHRSYHGTSAVIEYAVKILKVKHIIIMGHTKCGGIEALVKSGGQISGDTDFVDKWMDIARPAIQKALDKNLNFEQQCRICGQESIKISLNNLSSFPFVAAAVKQDALALHGMIFDIESCKMHEYNPATDSFEEII